MKLWIGTTAEGERVWLSGREQASGVRLPARPDGTGDDFKTHFHGIGISRLGKSKLIEWICRELIKQGYGFCLIDPHGSLYNDVLRWCAHVRPAQQIFLLNPSRADRLAGFNPFTCNQDDEAEIFAKADRMVGATIRAWGEENTDRTPRLSKMLRTLYYTLLEQGISLSDAGVLLRHQASPERTRILENMKSERIRSRWKDLYAMRPAEFITYMESTENRLERFLVPQVERVFKAKPIDVGDVIDEGHVLLVNLQSSGTFLAEHGRTIGALLVNEIWETMRQRTTPKTFFLIMDEFQEFLTPDIEKLLDQTAKYGLHLFLFHQRIEQLPAALKGAMENAHTQVEFHDRMRQFTLRRLGRAEVECEAPLVAERYAPDDELAAFTAECLRDFPTIAEIDAMPAMAGQGIATSSGPGTLGPGDLKDDDFFE